MKKGIFILVPLLILTFHSKGQNEADALRYSMDGLVGSARVQAMGGAYSAVGADLSSASINPAGLGLYRRSDFSLTPTFRFVSNEAQYLDQGGSGDKTHLSLSNLGVAFNNNLYRGYGRNRQPVETGLKSYTFAIGYNHLNNYHREVNASGFNDLSSITDYFTEFAQGIDVFNLAGDVNSIGGLAYEAFALDTLSGSTNSYFPAVNDGRIDQRLQVLEEGRKSEWYISLAGNFSDRFFIGLSIGIQSLRYSQRFVFQEQDTDNLHATFQNNPNFPLETDTDLLEYTDQFSSRGTGINARLGIILRPSDAFRFGLSVQTPTYLNLGDEFSRDITHTLDASSPIGAGPYEASSDILATDYNLATPYKLTLGAMYLAGKSGFISADVEILDYTSASLSTNVPLGDPNYYDFNFENNNISNLLEFAVNYRVGGELRLDVLRLRAGGALYGATLTEEASLYEDFNNLGTLLDINTFRRFITAGIGIRQPGYYVDVTFVNERAMDKTSPYTTANTAIFSPTLVNDKNGNTIMMSIGFTF